MNGRGSFLIALGAILVIAGAAAFFLLDDGTGSDLDVDLIGAGSTTTSIPDQPVVAVEEGVAARVEIPDISPLGVETETVKRQLPAAYRAALAKVIGRVLLEDGTPVTDLDVMIGGGRLGTFRVPQDAYFGNESLLDENALLDVIAGRAVTDAEGRFEMTDVEPRTIGLVLLDPGGPRSHYTLLDKSPSTGAVTDLGDIILPLGIKFFGRVIDDNGEPVVNARVRAAELPPFPGVASVADVRVGSGFVVSERDVTFFYRPPERLMRLERYLPVPTTYTDELGEFVLERVPQGLMSVLVDRVDMVATVHGPTPTGAPGNTRDLGDIRMDPGVSMSGRVVDLAGEPIPGAEVMAGNDIGGFVPVTVLKGSILSDEEGRFEVPGLMASTGRAAAKSPDRSTFVVSDKVVPGDDVTIVIGRPRQITASVVDKSDEPISGVTFYGRSLPDVNADELPNFLKPPSAMQTGAEETEPGIYVLEKLDPAVWEIAARVPGHGTAIEVVDLRDLDRERVTFRMEGGADLNVTVASASDEEPLEYAMVDVFSPGEDFPIQSRRTSANGLAEFVDLPPGEISLLITHPALAVKEERTTVDDDEPTDVTVLLDVGATVRGSVLDNGKAPNEPMMVTLTHDDSDSPDFSDALIPLLTYTDREGNFEFLDVDPGSIELQARPMFDQGLGPTAFGMTLSQSPLAEESMNIGPGEEVNATLIVGSAYDDIETGSLHGRLLVNGRPPEGWSIFVWGKVRRSTTVADDGTFDLGIVAAGEVEMQFSAHGMNFGSRGVAATRQIEVGVGERKFFDVSLRVGSVSGRVMSGDDGEPVEGVRVFATPADGGMRGGWGQAGAMSAADGTFEIDPVEAGEYTLGSWGEGYTAAKTETFKLGEMQRRTGMTLVVSRALTASGTVTVLGLAEPPSFMRLVAENSSTGERDWAWVDRDSGEFEFDRLSPGTWAVTLATEFEEEDFAPVTIEVFESQENMMLTYRYSPAPEEDDEIDEEMAQQLGALGYIDGGG